MQQHAVPQNVTSFEFKIVGFLTLKQFAMLGSCVVIGFIAFLTIQNMTIKIGTALFFGGLGVLLAFGSVQQIPFYRWIIIFFQAIFRPTQRIWIKSATPPTYFTTTYAANDLQTERTIEDKNALTSYLQTLPSQKKTELDILELQKLQALNLNIPQNTNTAPTKPTQAPPRVPNEEIKIQQPAQTNLTNLSNLGPTIPPINEQIVPIKNEHTVRISQKTPIIKEETQEKNQKNINENKDEKTNNEKINLQKLTNNQTENVPNLNQTNPNTQTDLIEEKIDLKQNQTSITKKTTGDIPPLETPTIPLKKAQDHVTQPNIPTAWAGTNTTKVDTIMQQTTQQQDKQTPQQPKQSLNQQPPTTKTQQISQEKTDQANQQKTNTQQPTQTQITNNQQEPPNQQTPSQKPQSDSTQQTPKLWSTIQIIERQFLQELK